MPTLAFLFNRNGTGGQELYLASEARCSWPHILNTPDPEAEVELMMAENRRVTTDDVVGEMKTSHASAHYIIQNVCRIKKSLSGDYHNKLPPI